MSDDLVVRRPSVLQHILDQVDAAARAVELVAERDIGRTGRRAETAMHASAQDLLGFRHVRIGELAKGEGGLHQPIRPGLRMALGSNSAFSRAESAASDGGCGSNTGTAVRTAGEARTSVAWPPPCARTIRRTRSASASLSSRSQIKPPCQS